jgi:hypothetical protein
MDMKNIETLPIWVWILLAAALFCQALWIYRDAARRGEHALLWGFFGLLNIPSNLLVYLLVTRLIMKSRTCPECGKRIGEKAKYCPACGRMQEEKEKQEDIRR